MKVSLHVSLFVLATTGPGLQAQQVQGRLLFTPGDQPISRAIVQVSELPGSWRVDEHGAFGLPGDRLPTVLELYVQVICSTRSWTIPRVPVDVGPFTRIRPPDSDTIASILVPRSLCTETFETRRPIETEGLLRSGFEVRSFKPCRPFLDLDAAGRFDARQNAWVDFEVDPSQLPLPDPLWVREGAEAHWYLRVRGTLLGPGNFGHLGASPFQLTVDTILEVRKPMTGDCVYESRRIP